MKVFIFSNVLNLTTSYHPEGGLVVIARDVEHGKELIASESARMHETITVSESDWVYARVVPCANADEQPGVYVFPNAGCC